MSDLDFLNEIKAVSSELINMFGAAVAILKKSEVLRNSQKPWEGTINVFSGSVVQADNFQVDETVFSDGDRVTHTTEKFEVKGSDIIPKSSDLISSLGNGISDTSLATVSVSSDFDINGYGVYNVDGGNINGTIQNGADIFFVSTSISSDNTTISPPGGFTINGSSTDVLNNSSVVGYKLSGTEYKRLNIRSVTDIQPSTLCGEVVSYLVSVGS